MTTKPRSANDARSHARTRSGTARAGHSRARRVLAAVAGMGAVLAMVAPAAAQLTPKRLYNGLERPITIEVGVPNGLEAKPTISIYEYGATEPEKSADVDAGTVDLAEVFSDIWSDPFTRARLVQLSVGDEKIGPPLVLQPMMPADVAFATQDAMGRPRAQFAPKRPGFYGYRVYVDKNIVLDTSEGEIAIHLRPDAAPNTAYNFRHLAEGGFYTEILVHRVIGVADGATEGFVIQAGDPIGNGQGGPGFSIDLEQSDLPHDYGVVSMARSSDPNSNGSQFFICLGRTSTQFLDTQYTAFGEVVRGRDAVEKIQSVPTGDQNRPDEPPVIHSATLVDAPPAGEPQTRIANPRLDEGER